MESEIQTQLNKMSDDFLSVTGKRFNNFYCPILNCDEDVELCMGHIVNEAFSNSSRRRILQRKDVDNFYGSAFESDFTKIHYRENGSLGQAFVDQKMATKYKPRILVDGNPVEHFVATGNIPEKFSAVQYRFRGKEINLGLKITKQEFDASLDKKWEIEINRDLRLSAVVSMIKAAYLTLFAMMGYRYALSAAGYFVGRQTLGEFFLNNYEKSKDQILVSARLFFEEFIHMVRPLQSCSVDIQGTISDRKLIICRNDNSRPWGLIVFIKTSKSLHSVILPIFEDAEASAKYLNFLKNQNESIEGNFCMFDEENWKMDPKNYSFDWPKEIELWR